VAEGQTTAPRSGDTELRVRSHYVRSYEPGQVIFEAGHCGDRLYVIQAGEVELARDGAGGRRVVARLGPGDFFGELGVVLGHPSQTRAVAANHTRIVELDRDTLEAMCVAQPQIAIRMIRVLSARLIEAERRLADLGVDDLRRAVVRALVRCAEPHPQGGAQVPLALRGLAEEAGLSMREAHRALHPLFDARLVRLVDDRLVVPDLDALNASLDAS